MDGVLSPASKIILRQITHGAPIAICKIIEKNRNPGILTQYT